MNRLQKCLILIFVFSVLVYRVLPHDPEQMQADFAHKKFFVQKSTETGKTGKPDLFCSGDYDARVSRRRLRELLVVRLILVLEAC